MNIERVSSTKFLGVIINQTLTWKDHISAIRQKYLEILVSPATLENNLPHLLR